MIASCGLLLGLKIRDDASVYTAQALPIMQAYSLLLLMPLLPLSLQSSLVQQDLLVNPWKCIFLLIPLLVYTVIWKQ